MKDKEKSVFSVVPREEGMSLAGEAVAFNHVRPYLVAWQRIIIDEGHASSESEGTRRSVCVSDTNYMYTRYYMQKTRCKWYHVCCPTRVKVCCGEYCRGRMLRPRQRVEIERH